MFPAGSQCLGHHAGSSSVGPLTGEGASEGQTHGWKSDCLQGAPLVPKDHPHSRFLTHKSPGPTCRNHGTEVSNRFLSDTIGTRAPGSRGAYGEPPAGAWPDPLHDPRSDHVTEDGPKLGETACPRTPSWGAGSQMSSDPTPQEHPPSVASPVLCVQGWTPLSHCPPAPASRGPRRTSLNRKVSESHVVPVCAGDATSLTASSDVHQDPRESCSWKSQSPVPELQTLQVWGGPESPLF